MTVWSLGLGWSADMMKLFDMHFEEMIGGTWCWIKYRDKGKEEIKDNFQVSGLSKYVGDDAISWDEQDWKEQGNSCLVWEVWSSTGLYQGYSRRGAKGKNGYKNRTQRQNLMVKILGGFLNHKNRWGNLREECRKRRKEPHLKTQKHFIFREWIKE